MSFGPISRGSTRCPLFGYTTIPMDHSAFQDRFIPFVALMIYVGYASIHLHITV